MNTPLSITMENARAFLTESLNRVVAETKLPAYLLEGILMELVADVRKRKAVEIANDMIAENAEQEKINEPKE